MTEAVIDVLENKVRRQTSDSEKSLRERVAVIVAELHAKAKPGGHDMTKDEIAEMWGHGQD